MNLANFLVENLNENKIALIEKSEKITYERIREQTWFASQLFKEKGIRKGDYVLILTPMSIDLYVTLIGLWSIGAIAMVFDVSSGSEHIRKCAAIIKPKAMITTNKTYLLSLLNKELRSIAIKVIIDRNKLRGSEQSIKVEDVNDDYEAIITFTSGSTGIPKVAVRTHSFLLKQYDVLSKTMKYTDGDIDLATLPIFTLANIMAGITTVLPNTSLKEVAKINSCKVLKQIKEHKVNRITASPAFLKRLLDRDQVLGEIKNIYTGGGPIFPEDMKNLKRKLPNSNINIVYGSTEAEPIAEIEYQSIGENDFFAMKSGRGLLVGRPIADIKCKIIKAEWSEKIGKLTRDEFDKISRSREIGEIVVSGEHVLKGYYHGVGDDENKFDVENERWHRTGDVGYYDEQGRLWLMGKAAAVIKDERGEIYPFAIDCMIHEEFGVCRSAVIKDKGLRVLILEKSGNVDLKKVKEKLNFVQIDKMIIIKKMPVDKRHNTKIDYGELRKLVK